MNLKNFELLFKHLSTILNTKLKVLSTLQLALPSEILESAFQTHTKMKQDILLRELSSQSEMKKPTRPSVRAFYVLGGDGRDLVPILPEHLGLVKRRWL